MSKSHASALLNSAPVALAYVDEQHKVREINATYCIWLKQKEEDIVGNRIEDIDPNFSEYRNFIDQVLSGEPALFTFENTVPSTRRYIQTTLTPSLEDDNITGFFICLEDISPLKSAHDDLTDYVKELQTSRMEAQRASEMKSQFLANMTHELRTPMNGVIGMSALLLDSELPQEAESSVKIIKQSAENLLELINDILDFSKIESGKLELENVQFDPRTLIKEVMELLPLKHKAESVDIVVDISDDIPQTIEGDAARVRQILYNLVGNALKFTESGYILVSLKMLEVLNNQHQRLSLTVEDTGIGIPEDKHVYIFDMFNQADSSTTRKFGGTGLGLSICRELADLMEGELKLKSSVGKGSTFRFDCNFKVIKPPALPGTPAYTGYCALLINDNEHENSVLSHLLRQMGFKVTAVDTIKRGNARLTEESYDIVFIDRMLEKDISVALLISALHLGNEKIILLSSGNHNSNELVSAGVTAHLERPVWRNRLEEMLRRVLEPEEEEELSDDDILKHLEAKAGLANAAEGDALLLFDRHILIAEDNPVNQIVAQRMLQKWNCKVTTVGNGKEALEMASAIPFDVILMDCQMPEMDGFEATAALRQLEAEGKISPTPIIAVTANVSEEDRQTCLQAGMDDYIAKPLEPSELRRVLVRWVREEDPRYQAHGSGV